MREDYIIDKATCLVDGEQVSFEDLIDGMQLTVEGILADDNREVSISGYFDAETKHLIANGSSYGIVPKYLKSTEHSIPIEVHAIVGDICENTTFLSPSKILALIKEAINSGQNVRLNGYVINHYRYAGIKDVVTSPVMDVQRNSNGKCFAFTRNTCYEIFS